MILGIDPGSRQSGIVLRDGDDVAYWELVEREQGETIEHYARIVAHAAAEQAAAVVAVENVRPMGRVHRRDVIETAIVVGWCCALNPGFVLVAPDGHGSSPLLSYPRSIVGDTEQKGTGWRRHLRSAYDCAGVVQYG